MNTVLHETQPNLFIYLNGIIMDSEISMKRKNHSTVFPSMKCNNHSIVFPSRYYHDCTLLLHSKTYFELVILLMAEGTRDIRYL